MLEFAWSTLRIQYQIGLLLNIRLTMRHRRRLVHPADVHTLNGFREGMRMIKARDDDAYACRCTHGLITPLTVIADANQERKPSQRRQVRQ
jgi:hypothetical protein